MKKVHHKDTKDTKGGRWKNFLQTLRLTWRLIRVGDRSTDIADQLTFWSGQADTAFRDLKLAIERCDPQGYEDARARFELARRRFYEEGKEVLP